MGKAKKKKPRGFRVPRWEHGNLKGKKNKKKKFPLPFYQMAQQIAKKKNFNKAVKWG